MIKAIRTAGMTKLSLSHYWIRELLIQLIPNKWLLYSTAATESFQLRPQTARELFRGIVRSKENFHALIKNKRKTI